MSTTRTPAQQSPAVLHEDAVAEVIERAQSLARDLPTLHDSTAIAHRIGQDTQHPNGPLITTAALSILAGATSPLVLHDDLHTATA